MGKQFSDATDKAVNKTEEKKDRLAAFSAKSTNELNEGTAQYYKWEKEGTSADFLFKGIDFRPLDKDNPTEQKECAILEGTNGERYLMAQTIIVKELKKKWDDVKEVDFPVRIIYNGYVGTGSDRYQSFRLLFE